MADKNAVLLKCVTMAVFWEAPPLIGKLVPFNTRVDHNSALKIRWSFSLLLQATAIANPFPESAKEVLWNPSARRLVLFLSVLPFKLRFKMLCVDLLTRL
jgi:hypothetical protein